MVRKQVIPVAASPQRLQIGLVTRRHGLGERTAVDDGVHHARESLRVRLVEEGNKKPRLPVGQLDAK